MSAAAARHVYLVGAGPGPLDLLTLRAHALISSATCILHDDLVSPEVLALASPMAITLNVGKRCGTKTITQQQINKWMVQYALDGHSVVRLKSGDPLLFGRAAEEIEALTEAALPFEIIPGISTGFAAAALAGVPLTGRITNSRVLFATRHLAAGATSGLAGITPEGTLVLYMPGRDYAAIANELTANGWSQETLCVLASTLGASTQQTSQCMLRDLPGMRIMPTPALMLFFPQA
jgi:uroporphyrin-III C-methyltransferase